MIPFKQGFLKTDSSDANGDVGKAEISNSANDHDCYAIPVFPNSLLICKKLTETTYKISVISVPVIHRSDNMGDM
jgi:hypothetical protein